MQAALIGEMPVFYGFGAGLAVAAAMGAASRPIDLDERRSE